MAKKSFLERVQPSRERSKLVDWPFPVEGGEEPPKVKVRVLGFDELEAARLATMDHFKALKRNVSDEENVFLAHENAEIVFRAYSVDGEPLAADVAELTAQPLRLIAELHATWSAYQADVTAAPMTAKQMDAFVEMLKKNTGADLLRALPSSWLIGLITTLASRLSASTPANEHG
jgi:hypothetical protein